MRLQFFPSAASLIPHSFFDKMQAQKLEVLPRLREESDMTNGCSSIDRGNSAADKSMHSMLAFRLSALAIFAAAVHIAVAEEVTLPAGYVPVNLVTNVGGSASSDTTALGNDYTVSKAFDKNTTPITRVGSAMEVHSRNAPSGLSRRRRSWTRSASTTRITAAPSSPRPNSRSPGRTTGRLGRRLIRNRE